jgi:hypothetical protein
MKSEKSSWARSGMFFCTGMRFLMSKNGGKIGMVL